MLVCSVRELTKRYTKGNVLANDCLSFDLHQGDIFGLLGPNGAGKTTLVRQLMGLVKPTSGSIQLFGRDVVQDPEGVPKMVSYMTQRPTALADLTVKEALTVTGRLRGLTSPEAKKQADQLIEEFELEKIASRVLGKLSGGQQRITGFCLALVSNRPMLVLDEPTNDLDPVYRKLVWDKLGEVNRSRGTTIILVTHNVTEAEGVLKRVGIINQGRITALGSVGELKGQVDQLVRLELLFKNEIAQELQSQLLGKAALPVRELAGNRWLALVPKEQATEDIHRVLTAVGLERLDDFRILMPTLEDVYLQLGGGEQLAKTS